MIAALWRLGWLQLARDRGALVLTFVLPVAFFSVFAAVFGEFDAGSAPPVTTHLVIEDDSPAGATVAAAILAAAGLDARTATAPVAEAALARGAVAALVTVPRGLGAALAAPGSAVPRITIAVDPSNPVARAGIGGIVTDAVLDALAPPRGQAGRAAAPAPVIEVLAAPRFARNDASTAFYAAGLGVMFLLFSLSMRAGCVIDERGNGLAARLAAAGIGTLRLGLARWLYLASVGVLQLGVMFAWAAGVFALRIDGAAVFAGVAAMVVASAAAAASFGLLLAELCASRAQLTAAATTLVLIMSALGGSMVPRFLMPPAIVEAGYLTLNAWAVDGFRKALWYAEPPAALVRELAVLGGCAAGLFAIACAMHRARRRA